MSVGLNQCHDFPRILGSHGRGSPGAALAHIYGCECMNTSMKVPIVLTGALDAFASLSDATRLRIVRVLIESANEMCVCEIMDSIHETQNNVSRHLKILRQAGLVEEGKKGKWVLYSVVQPLSGTFIAELLEAIRSLPGELFTADVKRMKARLSLRKSNECVVGMNSDEWQKECAKIHTRGRVV